jgi:hypothetical protein
VSEDENVVRFPGGGTEPIWPGKNTHPLFVEGNDEAVVHGAQSDRHLQPVVAGLLEHLEEVAPWTRGPAFASVVESWAWAEAQAVLYRRHFDRVGLGLEAKDQPKGLDRWARAEGSAARLRGELGLTPASLTRLLAGLSAVDGPAAVSGLDALRSAGAALRSAVGAPALPDRGADEVDGESDEGAGDELHTGSRRGSRR